MRKTTVGFLYITPPYSSKSLRVSKFHFMLIPTKEGGIKHTYISK